MSANIINASEEFERRKVAGKFARLLGLAEAQESAILSNPLPYLADMGARFEALLAAVDEAIYDLDGRINPTWDDGPIRSTSGVMLERNSAARDRLQKAREAARKRNKQGST